MALLSSGVVKGRRCPICGAEHNACGLPYQGRPTDIREAPTVVDSHDLYIFQDAEGHTFQMTEEDARDSGYTRVGGQPARELDQQRAEDSENAPAPAAEEPKARDQAANKARQPSENK